MKLSIIVPVYNIEDYVGKCVDSIVSQSLSDMEIILVDDGSRDRSPAICDSYASEDRRVRVIHKENGGIISARSAGLSLASGEYIMFVDGDDWLMPDCLEKVAAAVVRTDADLLCFGSLSVYPDRTVPQLYPYEGLYLREQIEKEIFPVLIEDSRGSHIQLSFWGKVFKKSKLLDALRYADPRILMGEDGAVVRPYLFRSSSIFFLKESLYCYNKCNRNSVTQALKPVDWDNTLLIRKGLQSVFPPDGDWPEQINRNTCHNTFITVMSRFNSASPFREIRSDIRLHLSDGTINSALRNCGYSGISRKLSCFLLLHKCVLAIYLYYKLFYRNE